MRERRLATWWREPQSCCRRVSRRWCWTGYQATQTLWLMDKSDSQLVLFFWKIFPHSIMYRLKTRIIRFHTMHCMRSRWSVLFSLVSCYTTDSPWLWPSIYLGLSWSNLLFAFWEEKSELWDLQRHFQCHWQGPPQAILTKVDPNIWVGTFIR